MNANIRRCVLLGATLLIATTLASRTAFGQSYNKLKAINYAWQHASAGAGQGNSAYNPNFFDPNNCYPFGADISDCTDFVSQCMLYGGQQQVRDFWLPYFWVSNWYFDDRGSRDYSHTWDNAQDLKQFLDQSKRGYYIDPRNADPGDVVFADWGDGNGISHTMIATKNDESGNLGLTQHTENRIDKPLSQYRSDNPRSSYYCYHFVTNDKVEYQAHVAGAGWMDPVADGAVTGTTGRGIQMEALRILAPERNIFYQAHVAGAGWMAIVRNGELAGTTGHGLQMEAVRIYVNRGHVYYRAHVAYKGWLPWVRDGADAGTTGQGIQMEALQVYITN